MSNYSYTVDWSDCTTAMTTATSDTISINYSGNDWSGSGVVFAPQQPIFNEESPIIQQQQEPLKIHMPRKTKVTPTKVDRPNLAWLFAEIERYRFPLLAA